MESKQTNSKMKERIVSYRKFVEETVRRNDVLSKFFYVVVPFSTLEMGIKSAKSEILGSLPLPGRKKNVQKLPFPKDYILEKAKASLEPKRDHLIRLFSRLGLEAKVLESKKLIELFYRMYNEEVATEQKIQTLNYGSPMVTSTENDNKTTETKGGEEDEA
jgi:hypothetical protein